VDTVTLTVCSSLGRAGEGESVPSVAGCGEDGALEDGAHLAPTIDELARRVDGLPTATRPRRTPAPRAARDMARIAPRRVLLAGPVERAVRPSEAGRASRLSRT